MPALFFCRLISAGKCLAAAGRIRNADAVVVAMFPFVSVVGASLYDATPLIPRAKGIRIFVCRGLLLYYAGLLPAWFLEKRHPATEGALLTWHVFPTYSNVPLVVTLRQTIQR